MRMIVGDIVASGVAAGVAGIAGVGIRIHIPVFQRYGMHCTANVYDLSILVTKTYRKSRNI